MNTRVTKRLDGKFEERLDDKWLAEYSENPETGLWKVELFHQDVVEWNGQDFTSLEEAQQTAHDFYNQV